MRHHGVKGARSPQNPLLIMTAGLWMTPWEVAVAPTVLSAVIGDLGQYPVSQVLGSRAMRSPESSGMAPFWLLIAIALVVLEPRVVAGVRSRDRDVPGPASAGPNVCGSKCCPGWNETLHSKRCIRPICRPSCKNHGYCLRPQLCLCKAGFSGTACQLARASTSKLRGRGWTGASAMSSPDRVPRHDVTIARSTHKSSESRVEHPPIVHLSRRSRQSWPRILDQRSTRARDVQMDTWPLRGARTADQYRTRPQSRHPGIGPARVPSRLHMAFTVTNCKSECLQMGHCPRRCSKGNVTNLVSDGTRVIHPPQGSGFRLVVCTIQCMNGGRCRTRDTCWCPANFTGKFCHIPVQNNPRENLNVNESSKSSIFLMPMSSVGNSDQGDQQSQPDLVNVQVQHPVNTILQFHRVSRIPENISLKDYLSQYAVRGREEAHLRTDIPPWHHNRNVSWPMQTQQGPGIGGSLLGHCFLSFSEGRCLLPTSGRASQEACCNSLGAAWGVLTCIQCLDPLDHPLSLGGHLLRCQKGYVRKNRTHCTDIDECSFADACAGKTCTNHPGSYRCSCTLGHVWDSLNKRCIYDGVSPKVTAPCFLSVESERCTMAMSVNLTRQMCCCGVGKAWGAPCVRCPPPGYDNFFKTCPGGMGHHLLSEDTNRKVQSVVPELVNRKHESQPSSMVLQNNRTSLPQRERPSLVEGLTMLRETPDLPQTSHKDKSGQPHITLTSERPNQLQMHTLQRERQSEPQILPPLRERPSPSQPSLLQDKLEQARTPSPQWVETSHAHYSAPGKDTPDEPQTGPLRREDNTLDVNECTNSSSCGTHAYCFNTNGSFECICDQGYSSDIGGDCVDVDECKVLEDACGSALCENVDGSFVCVCPSDGQWFDLSSKGCKLVERASSQKSLSDLKVAFVKEPIYLQRWPVVNGGACYYNLEEPSICSNILAPNVSLENCCCTVGGGWGLDCNIYPCPEQGTEKFSMLCPMGKGKTLTRSGEEQGVDECVLFGAQLCKDGVCVDSANTFECLCRTGYSYNPKQLQCIDVDECEMEGSCIDGLCHNTRGSYVCHCETPLSLDMSGKRCVNRTITEPGQSAVFLDVCWKDVSQNWMCGQPITEQKTTYTECCCLHGRAWGVECALCPPEASEDFVLLCNTKWRSGRPRHEDFALGPQQGLHYIPQPINQRPRSEVPHASVYLPDIVQGPKDEVAGLQAQECGIAHGCENGRCVRVPDGFTCDCYDGFHLNLAQVICVDVDECAEVESLCMHGRCLNTEGSYQCICDWGYRPVLSDSPKCVPDPSTWHTIRQRDV
uniref:latent-transforming growth factor beta-binding protein 1-like isoform X2 n=1 Tax=Myxine glutinosa TaxID=7769 RepID=UPI00358EA769